MPRQSRRIGIRGRKKTTARKSVRKAKPSRVGRKKVSRVSLHSERVRAGRKGAMARRRRAA